MSQTITVPTVGTNTGFSAVQTYNYDSLNRLKDATEMLTPHGGSQSQSWKQTFTFDRYGNRNFDEANTAFAGFDKLCNNNTELCADLRKRLNPSINTSNNRLSTSDDYDFDESGNTTEDPDDRTFIYDAENKQIEVRDSQQNIIGQYRYDGDGKRIKKIVPTTGETTIFVYNASGQLVAEYSTEISQDPKVSYTTADYLGSPRILTDENGTTISRRDFMPYGEEIARTGYGQASVREKFATYERDEETDLDFAQARYYAKSLGRFNSADEPFLDQFEDNPQSWNLYLYVRNNPLNMVDPLGTTADCPPDSPAGCYERDGKYYIKDENGAESEVTKDGVIIIDSSDESKSNATLLQTRGRPRRGNQFDRFFRDLGELFRRWWPWSRNPPRQSTPPPAKNVPYGPPSPPQTNARANLPGAAQRLPNMDSLSSGTAANMLQSAGFSHRSTTSGGNQRWKHPDGSVVWISNNGKVDRVPGRNAIQQSGLTGKGWRVDAATGKITRPHQNVSTEIVY